MGLFGGRGRPKKQEEEPKSPEELKNETIKQDGSILTPDFFEPLVGDNPHYMTAKYLGFIAHEFLKLNVMLEMIINGLQEQAAQIQELSKAQETPEEIKKRELAAKIAELNKELEKFAA